MLKNSYCLRITPSSYYLSNSNEIHENRKENARKKKTVNEFTKVFFTHLSTDHQDDN